LSKCCALFSSEAISYTLEPYLPTPLIGLTSARTLSQYGTQMISVAEAYISALESAGACPVVIPLGLGENVLKLIYNRLDGVLFTGGGDVHPGRYGSQSHPKVSLVDEDRDRIEFMLVRRVVDGGTPFLGICRGLQLINVALGGSLYEDLSDQHPGSLKHDYFPGYPRDELVHTVKIDGGSLMNHVVGNTEIQVNSLHHQGIRRLAQDLSATAQAPDGVKEAVELPGHPFGLAVQWHPEWLQEHAAMRTLFESFVGAIRENAGTRLQPR